MRFDDHAHDSALLPRLAQDYLIAHGKLAAADAGRMIALLGDAELDEAFELPGGPAVADYAALTYQGGAAWRERLLRDIGQEEHVAELLTRYDDEELSRLMTNLGGHCLESLIATLRESLDIAEGDEWVAYAGLGNDAEAVQAFVSASPLRARRAHRDHLAGRHGLDQPRCVGQSARLVSTPGVGRCLSHGQGQGAHLSVIMQQGRLHKHNPK